MKTGRKLRQPMTAGQKTQAGVVANESLGALVRIGHHFHVECFDKHGKMKWEDHFDNLVVNEGLDEYLDNVYNSAAFTSAHFVGLTDGTPTFAAGDTMASHAGWVEVIEYQAQIGSPAANVRPEFQPGAAASQSLSNTLNKAVFAIVAPGGTVGGAFISTDGAKNGTAGVLMGGNVFTGGDRVLAGGDTLNVTVTASMTSS